MPKKTKRNYVINLIGLILLFFALYGLFETGVFGSRTDYLKGIATTACYTIIMVTSLNLLVGIMGENDLYYNTPLTKEFNAFLKSVNAEVTEVPIRSFLASGTRVDTVIVKIKKPE